MTAEAPGHPRNALSAAEAAAVRDGIAEAVLGTPDGLRADLEVDPDAYLRLVSASRTAAEETSRLLRDSINGARAAGHSWDALGRVLGVSRQAAQQRFTSATKPATDHAGAIDQLERKVISPITAFDEMAVLADEGRHGWHIIDSGTLFHVLESSGHQWEHRRLLWTPGNGARRHLEAAGWSLVGDRTFPWGYYSRPLDTPAEPA
jgi:malate synthase